MGVKGRKYFSHLVRKFTSKSFLFLSLFVLIVGNEYVMHFWQYMRWPSVPLDERYEGDMVLLLVSDPQILGYQREPPFPIGYFTRWDADRYISRSFSMAHLHTSPDVVVFLGDLMDEGSIATDEEYDIYYKRFQEVFIDAANTKKIYIPGDNDIGGEGHDFRTKEKISRFERYFEYLTGSVKYRFTSFFKLDVRFSEPFLPKHKKILQEVGEEIYMPFRIILNHESISPKLKSHVYPLLKPIRPHMIISGHWHKANLFICDDCLSRLNEDGDHWPLTRRDLTPEEDIIKIETDERSTLVEIMVPTCSYRMGEPYMGYGVLIINDSGEMRYMTLWCPPRYITLYMYAVYAIYVSLIITCSAVKRLFVATQGAVSRNQVPMSFIRQLTLLKIFNKVSGLMKLMGTFR